MKERVSKLTYPTLQHCQRMLYTINGNFKHQGRAIGKKGDINCSSKRSTSISCKNPHLHIMSFITTKFHVILLSGFSGVVLTNCFSSIFHFRQFSKFKKGVTPTKKRQFPVDMRIYTLCPSQLQSFMKFCRAVSEELR